MGVKYLFPFYHLHKLYPQVFLICRNDLLHVEWRKKTPSYDHGGRGVQVVINGHSGLFYQCHPPNCRWGSYWLHTPFHALSGQYTGVDAFLEKRLCAAWQETPGWSEVVLLHQLATCVSENKRTSSTWLQQRKVHFWPQCTYHPKIKLVLKVIVLRVEHHLLSSLQDTSWRED